MSKSLKSKIMIIVIAVVVIILIAIGVFVFKYNSNKNTPFESNQKSVDITVQKNEYMYSVLNDLEKDGMLKSDFLTKVYLKLNPASTDIKPGNYQVNSNMDLKDFVNMLTEGQVMTYKVTFPEGFTIDKMAQTLQAQGIMSADTFTNAVKNYPLPSYIKPNSERRYNLEGFLYPNTYNIPKLINPTEQQKTELADNLIQMMLDQFQLHMNQAEKVTGVTVAPDQYEKIVTIASMIEGEAQTEKDAALVSSVIYNRLAKNMKLQLDATVLYAMGQHKDVVLDKDLQTQSPYNTYVVSGLPIGPICSPGIMALEAALKPAKTDYLYYVLNAGNNEHIFTNNYADFQKAANQYHEYLKQQQTSGNTSN
ncbi:MAG: endolytic transglycosylase MltG [Sarcina sp.]